MYPIVFEADYQERQSRLTTFFRGIVAIPWVLLSIFWTLVWFLCSGLAWFCILFTGRYPRPLYAAVTASVRWWARYLAWVSLMTDEWPGFGGGPAPGYPIRALIPEPQERYDRGLVLIRGILVIPVYVMIWIYSNVLVPLIAFVLWFTIVFAGKAPRGLWDVQRMAISYMTRGCAYWGLLTDRWPPLSDSGEDMLPPSPAVPPQAPAPPQSAYFGG
ncbi:DUF4389 domain-containing protein [Conexibacter sp. JD483]|uniref:DUF4389 domain-containing protein n=1 Tax=unclassified Conexibacter TaxID=2627773 RepID=UPI002722C04A|nr:MULTISPECIES: DUF4389 domain-containing protein [unclassified Conexibacter]MDO8186668.1 DUF4389 domain-containing protein [Conexibacter sp. CPCC 205706]MDO8200388.1 DUF4389 domain-containing protein [Conexibacter sp. CPCC 205762]MDR9370590.1 DUF4389 domain-containing protein [Conexibacter sp. JD483]